jgi:hypothetical protein
MRAITGAKWLQDRVRYAELFISSGGVILEICDTGAILWSLFSGENP